MKETLLARRQQAESAFNALQSSIQAIEAELKDKGFETIEAAKEELFRLQGDYRTINELLDKAQEEKSTKASSKAEVIDVSDVKGA